MGPAAFMWPPDREWSANMDNTAPCGTSQGVGNRTDFPLTGGAVALVDQDEGYDVQLSISYQNDPQSNADFNVLIASSNLKELAEGHTCVSIANPPDTVSAGSNATLQIIYTADFDSPQNQTFYACADITYVLNSDFTTSIPCFNATIPDDEASPTTTHGSSSATASSTSAATTSAAASGGSSKGISGGAIAGAVVGSIAGAAILGVAAFWLYRRHQRKNRAAQIERSARNVKWDVLHPGRDNASQNTENIPM